jgi:hypothetical protein
LTEAQEAFAQADPATLVPLGEEDRYPLLTSDDGGMAQRWLLLDSEPRRAPSPRTVDQQWLTQSERDTKAFQKLGRVPVANG